MGKKSRKKILVIVESPAKAKTINRYLGKEYIVDSSKGHLVDLPKSRMGIDIENNFQPEYKVIRGRMSIVKELKKKASSTISVLLAADPDREGEAISWHLSNVLKDSNPVIKRIIFNEITQEAILESLNNIKEIDMNKVDAQQARRVLDRLVGYNISPILWKKVKAGLSAGRVQSIALMFICQRENEVKAFKTDEYWTINAEFSKNSKAFSVLLKKLNDIEINITNKEEMEKHSSLLKEAQFKVSDIIVKERKRNPLSPYITSKLQQDSLNRLGYSAQRTMQIAQQLYEGVEIKEEGPAGLITYMRTDSIRISPVALEQTRNFIKEHFGPEYLPEVSPVYKNKKNAQDAHECIRPTSILRMPENIKESLTPEQFKLYQLIYNRFLGSQMNSAVLDQTGIFIKAVKDENNFEFQLNYSKYKFDGFTKVYSFNNKEEAQDIPDLVKDEPLELKELLSEQHFTQPPPRFNDASLIKILEESGIGRPSTYAPTISTLEYRYYIQREGRQLIPTELGKVVNNLLLKNFPEIFNINFTGEIEDKLDDIADAKIGWKQLLQDFYPRFKVTVEKALENIEAIEDFKKAVPTDEICSREGCGKPMVKKLGRFGYFLACSSFPDCRNTKSVPIADCPMPGCEGKIVSRRSKRKRAFFPCTSENCGYVLWSKPLKERCPKCNYLMVYSKIKKIMLKKCTNKDCDYQNSEVENVIDVG